MGTFGGRSKKQKRAHQTGVQAEHAAALYLRAKGYKVLTIRYRVKVGEIDIIAKHRGTIIFVEVKRRQSLDDALNALPARQQARIIRAAEFWLAENDLPLDTDCRFDMMVFSAYLVPHHIKNAFGTDGI